MIMRDMHLHTDFSDGENTPWEMAQAACELGYREICFTDHVRASSEWLPEYQKECRRVAEHFCEKMVVFCGVEAKVCDFHGKLDIPEKLEAGTLQIAALHRLPDGLGGFVRKQDLCSYGETVVDWWFRSLQGLRENERISRLAHPFSLVPYMPVSLNESFWEKVITYMEQGSYLIEYNLKYDNSFVPTTFWEHFQNRIVLGSDSHSAKALAQVYKQSKLVTETIFKA